MKNNSCINWYQQQPIQAVQNLVENQDEILAWLNHFEDVIAIVEHSKPDGTISIVENCYTENAYEHECFLNGWILLAQPFLFGNDGHRRFKIINNPQFFNRMFIPMNRVFQQHLEGIKKGIQEAHEGKTISSDEVMEKYGYLLERHQGPR